MTSDPHSLWNPTGFAEFLTAMQSSHAAEVDIAKVQAAALDWGAAVSATAARVSVASPLPVFSNNQIATYIQTSLLRATIISGTWEVRGRRRNPARSPTIWRV